MTVECAHPAVAEILQPSEIIQAWGPSACSLIPVWPGYGRLHSTETGDAVYLSKLTCGHYGMTSPTMIAAAEKKAVDNAYKPSRLEVSRLRLKLLLDKAHDGEEVTPAAELAEAQAAILLEERAAAGRRERAEAARMKADKARRKALEGPLSDELDESATNIQGARDNAFLALMALLDAVDEDMETQDNARATLLAEGFDPAEVRTANGYVQSTQVAGKAFPYFPKAEHLIAVLHAVQYSRHSNAFTSLNGRDLGRNLPAPIAGGPHVSPDAESG